MMTVKCPKCTTLLKFQPQAGAVRITCPKCATVMQVGGQSPKSATPPRPTQTRLGAKPKKSPQPTPQQNAAGNPQSTAPSKKRSAAVSRAAAPQKAAPTMPAADPLAAPAGGFDLQNLDLPAVGGLDGGSAPPGFAALPPGHPALAKPKAPPKPGKQAAAKSAKSANSGNKTVLWIGLGVAGLVGTLAVGGLAIFLMGGSETTVAQQSDPPAADVAAAPAADSAPPAADSAPPAADPSPEPTETPVAATPTPGDFETYSVGKISASFPPGKTLDQLPTGIQGQAIRSDATKATLYIAVGKIDPEATDQKKILRQVQRLVMADIYPGEPCQRSNLNGFQGRLTGGLVLPNMELELYKTGGEIIIIGWANPQHAVDLWTPLILQDKKPPVESDPKKVEAEKAAFLQSVQIKAPG